MIVRDQSLCQMVMEIELWHDYSDHRTESQIQGNFRLTGPRSICSIMTLRLTTG
jgi:hypothetical protein